MGIRLLSIDPSINFCGIAVFDDKKLVHYALLNPQTKSEDYVEKSKSIFNQVKQVVDKLKIKKVVVEIPEHWAAAGYLARESGAIYKVTFVAGMICSLDNVQTTTPSNWKKQLPKDVVFRRMNKAGAYKDLDFTKINNNIADAICIGHWSIYGRL